MGGGLSGCRTRRSSRPLKSTPFGAGVAGWAPDVGAGFSGCSSGRPAILGSSAGAGNLNKAPRRRFPMFLSDMPVVPRNAETRFVARVGSMVSGTRRHGSLEARARRAALAWLSSFQHDRLPSPQMGAVQYASVCEVHPPSRPVNHRGKRCHHSLVERGRR